MRSQLQMLWPNLFCATKVNFPMWCSKVYLQKQGTRIVYKFLKQECWRLPTELGITLPLHLLIPMLRSAREPLSWSLLPKNKRGHFPRMVNFTLFPTLCSRHNFLVVKVPCEYRLRLKNIRNQSFKDLWRQKGFRILTWASTIASKKTLAPSSTAFPEK